MFRSSFRPVDRASNRPTPPNNRLREQFTGIRLGRSCGTRRVTSDWTAVATVDVRLMSEKRTYAVTGRIPNTVVVDHAAPPDTVTDPSCMGTVPACSIIVPRPVRHWDNLHGDWVALATMGERGCFLDATCLSCGMFLEGADANAVECPRCGAAREPVVTGMGARATNFILYCDRWDETVDFYRILLGLTETFSNPWFVEFRLCGGASVSIADARRASIQPVQGRG